MLLAAHIAEILLLLLLPWGVARAVAHRFELPMGLFGVGLLALIAAEVFEIAAAPLIRTAFEAGWFPMPTRENIPLVEASIAAGVAALAHQSVRWWVFARQVPEHRDLRGAVLVGLGHGAGAAGLTALLVLGLALTAVLGEGATMEDLEALGLSGRTAVKIGLRIYAWWEGSPLDAAQTTLTELTLVAMHVGLSVLVARAVETKRWWLGLAAVLIHAAVALLVTLGL